MKKMCQKKRDEIHAKNTRECTKSDHFFKFFPEPPRHPPQCSLQPLKLNFDAPIEIRWQRPCDVQTVLSLGLADVVGCIGV